MTQPNSETQDNENSPLVLHENNAEDISDKENVVNSPSTSKKGENEENESPTKGDDKEKKSPKSEHSKGKDSSKAEKASKKSKKDKTKEKSKDGNKDGNKDGGKDGNKDGDKDGGKENGEDGNKENKDKKKKSSTSEKGAKPSKDNLKQKELEEKCKKLIGNHSGVANLLACYRLMSKKTFILTPTHFFLAKKDFKPNSKDSFVFPWNYMKTLEIGPKVVNLSFKSLKHSEESAKESSNKDKEKLDFRMEFLKNEYKEGVSRLCDTVQRVLLPSELKQLKFDKIGAPPIVIGALSAQNRFEMLTASRGGLLPETTKKMGDIITFSDPNVNISDFQDATSFVPIFFEVLPFIHSVETVKVPLLKELKIYDLASKLMKESTTLRAIKLTGHCKKMMSRFLTAIKETKGSQISGLSFNNTHVNVEDLDLIADIIANGKVRSIGFHHAFRKEAISYFYSSFLSPKVTDNLMSLNLDKTNDIELGKLFPKLRNVAMLSLAGCDLNIVSVFHLLALNSSSLPQLQMINLSNNNFTENADKIKFPQKVVRLPPNLRNFILNNIAWPEKVFKNLFEFLFDHVPNRLKLSLSKSRTTEKEWKSVFNFLVNSEYTSLSELVWDMNTVDYDMFKFLAKNTKLVKLQMNDCFGEQEPNLILAFCDYLTKSDSIQALLLRNTAGSSQIIGVYLSHIITAAKQMKNLTLLDIGNSRIGEKLGNGIGIFGNDTKVAEERDEQLAVSIRLLKELSESTRTLKFLNFDGMMPNETEPYIEVLKYFSEVNDHLLVSFPSDDLDRLLLSEKITKDDLELIMKLFYIVPVSASENAYENPLSPSSSPKTATASPFSSSSPFIGGEYKIDPWIDSKLSKPTNIYKLHNRTKFPMFVDFKLASRLSRRARPLSLSLSGRDIAGGYNGGYDDDDLAWDPSQYLSTNKFAPDEEDNAKYMMHSEPTKEISSSDDENEDEEKKKEKIQKKQMNQRFGSVRIVQNKNNKNNKPFAQQVEDTYKERSIEPINIPEELSDSLENEAKKEKAKNRGIGFNEEENKPEIIEGDKNYEYEYEEDEIEEDEGHDEDDKERKKIKDREADFTKRYESSSSSSPLKEEIPPPKRRIVDEYDGKLKKKLANVSSTSSSSSQYDKSDSENSEENDMNNISKNNNKLPPRGLPPIPPKKEQQAPDVIELDEPDYELPMLAELQYPISWKKLDKKVTLEGIYDKISSEKRSKVLEHYKKKK